MTKKQGVSKVNSSDYNTYLSAIKTANADGDKETLRRIQKQLISTYGLQDKDVNYLISQFRYNV